MASRRGPGPTAPIRPGAGARRARLACLILLLALCFRATAAEVPAAMDYLVQSNCVDGQGQAMPGVLPFEPGCTRRAPLLPSQGMGYRKHDWPAPEHRAGAPLGYQASDAYLSTLHGLPAAVQTFEFGGGPFRFGHFDPGADGGDAVVLRGGEASIALSEDSDGVKWLQGRGCRPGGALAPGWLSFDGPQGQRVAPNAVTPSADQCPRAFSMSLTRWHALQLDVPFLIRGRPAGRFPADLIVSDHFTHPLVGDSNAMERFWFARGLGKVRWESWVNLDHPGQDVAGWSAKASWFASTHRCPAVAGVAGPEAGRWVMVECRTWTNFDRAAGSVLIPLVAWPEQMRNR